MTRKHRVGPCFPDLPAVIILNALLPFGTTANEPIHACGEEKRKQGDWDRLSRMVRKSTDRILFQALASQDRSAGAAVQGRLHGCNSRAVRLFVGYFLGLNISRKAFKAAG